ncbi:unnamed protein product [Symbiodinium microadriaticum]|nr:unnamed protein product [Symbiodinium microadriaticum]
MTSLVDSSAHLNRRCRELELSESCSVALEGLGLTSLGRLAYAVGSPSESASEAQYQAWFEEHLPSTSIGDRSIVKRLITEAQTIVCAELREQVTSNLDAATVRKVPEAEREARMSELRRRLVGLQLEGANEPSHHLLDLCAAQERPGQLVYIEPSKCASRIHEAACTATGDAENFCMSRPPAIDPKLFATLCDACDFDLFVSDEPAEYRLDLRSVILASTHSPQATFTSIALLRNQSAHLHRDLNNALDSRNWAVPLSVFGSGGIWVAGLGEVECPQPLDDVPVGLGGVLSFEQGPVAFDSHQWHCTAPWTGDRKLLVGFTVKGFLDFPPGLTNRLSAGLFQLPPSATADVFEVHASHPYPVILELCSGLGRITAHARHHGARGSIAVDFTTAPDAAAVA